jgi:very-short-patch-repair endonuclease
VTLLKSELAEYGVQDEVSTGLYSIDLYLPELRIALEVDGSTHYYSLTDHEMGKSAFKYRLFKKAGIDTFRISYHKYATRTETQ